jgi:hypothetical protein
MSGYNAWYLVRGGDVHNVSSQLNPPWLPEMLALSLAPFALAQIVILYLMWRAAEPPIVLAAAAACFSFFLLATEVHERYLFPTIGLVLMAAAEKSRLWWMYSLLSLTFLFNLVTIMPFTPLLGTNLVAPQTITPTVSALKAIALAASALNLAAFGWLVYELWTVPNRVQRLISTSSTHASVSDLR